ncbi:mismatch repair protein [Lactobacillus phage LJ]|uniref:Mismatch repair protein n=1 Tax=Lactobacillus phage LJ TaxID=2041454 RepID=A0A2D1GPE2_9CAUD|nr:mismatch repair protein [Lactobacillus phage LJ]ATN93880.1 mismatch repair protein [Lactobacillus phage LJ]
MNKANEFTPEQIKTIRHMIRDEIARHDKEIEDEEDKLLHEMAAESAVTARDWGDLD